MLRGWVVGNFTVQMLFMKTVQELSCKEDTEVFVLLLSCFIGIVTETIVL